VQDQAWKYSGGYYELSHTGGGQPFTASDCDPPSFNSSQVTVSNIPYDVGSTSIAKQSALPEGTVTVNVPFSNWNVNNAYMLLPGGRGSARTFQVTFTYVDNSTAVADPFNVPHDCGGGGPFTDSAPVEETLTTQGQYPKANTCCNYWWDARFKNPQPAKAVKSITVYYQPSNNAGWGGGRVWAVTIN
jgi:hypothetical protein